MIVFSRSILLVFVLLVAGCGGGDASSTNTGGNAFVGRWQVENACAKVVDANGVEQSGWSKSVSAFTSTGELNMIGTQYSDAACTLGAVVKTTPFFSWVSTGSSILTDGTTVDRLTLTMIAPQAPADTNYKIALAVRNKKLCFSSNVVLTPRSFGVHAWAENMDVVDFANCLVLSQ